MTGSSSDLGGRPPSTGRTTDPEVVTATEAIGRDPELVELENRHRRFVWPMTVFFLVYYLLLMFLPGVASGFMAKKVFGNFTVAYLFALSQFVMTFIVAWLYTRFARRRFDPLADDLRAKRLTWDYHP